MRTDSQIVLDACVLAPFTVCDLLLRLAEEPRLYRPRWTEDILTEVRRTQVAKLGWPDHLADYWRQEVTASFPEALVTGYEPLVAECRCHPKDRHVLAAAIKAPAEAIVTFNVKHFPAHALEPHGIVAHHPADYLCSLFDLEPARLSLCLDEIAIRRRLEPIEVVRRLRGPLRRFAERVADSRGWTL